MSKNFTIEMKKSLANRIQKFTNTKDFIEVNKIIKENNPNLATTTNSNGIFMRFQNLTNETYEHIKKYVDAREKQEKLKKIQSEIIDSDALSEEIKNLTETSDNKNLLSKKYRLTIEETNLMNRIKYEKVLEENSKPDDDIFIHNTPTNKTSSVKPEEKRKSKK